MRPKVLPDALALSNVLGNLAAGVTILFTRPFRVGEYVSIVGVEGCVDSIGLFSTTLGHEGEDRSLVVVPNRKIVGEILHNLHLSVGVPYDADRRGTVAAIRQSLDANPRVLKDPHPAVQVGTQGDFAVRIHLNPWTSVADHGDAAGEIQPGLVRLLRDRGVELPVVPAIRRPPGDLMLDMQQPESASIMSSAMRGRFFVEALDSRSMTTLAERLVSFPSIVAFPRAFSRSIHLLEGGATS